MQGNWWYWVLLVGVNAPFFVWAGRWFFDGWEGFWECIRFWFTPFPHYAGLVVVLSRRMG